jgi:hypothetical protein
MTKKKKVKRQGLQQEVTSAPEKNIAEFTFGRLGDDAYCWGHHVDMDYTGAGISRLAFMGPGVSHYSVFTDKDVADLLDVMRKIVAIADALEVLK